MNSELEIAKSLADKSPRLSLVILDNLIELHLYEVIQNNAMFDYLEGNSHTSKSRLQLYSHFDSKVNYASKKNIFDQKTCELIRLCHKIRNSLYHKSDKIGISGFLVQYYLPIVEQLIKQDCNSGFSIDSTNSISNLLRSDLLNRVKVFRENIAMACTGSKVFDTTILSDDYVNDCMDHVFSNYGEGVIEKSSLKKEVKEKYIERFIKEQSSENFFFKMNKLHSIENKLGIFNWNDDVKSLTFWFEVDNEMKLYEEVVEVYVDIAC